MRQAISMQLNAPRFALRALMRQAISMQLNAPRLRSPCVEEGGNQHAIERTAASLSVREQQVDEQ
jgi:hypothetical protein